MPNQMEQAKVLCKKHDFQLFENAAYSLHRADMVVSFEDIGKLLAWLQGYDFGQLVKCRDTDAALLGALNEALPFLKGPGSKWPLEHAEQAIKKAKKAGAQ